MSEPSTWSKSKLREDIRLAIECIEIDYRPLRESASPKALEVIRTEAHFGPFLLVYGSGRLELERLLRELRLLDASLDSWTVSAESVASLIVRMDPIDVQLDGGQFECGEIRDLHRAGRVETGFIQPIGVQVRGASSAEAEHRIEWLLEQLGLPSGVAGGIAA